MEGYMRCCIIRYFPQVRESMGGTSGVILDIFFRATGNKLAGAAECSGAAVVEAVQAGVEAISFYGGAEQGMRTLLDALIPALAAVPGAGAGLGAVEVAALMAGGAAAGAEETRTMLAVAGRAAYVPAAQAAGVADPGARAVAIALAGAIQGPL
jgi:dihydroxyacetone kinase